MKLKMCQVPLSTWMNGFLKTENLVLCQKISIQWAIKMSNRDVMVYILVFTWANEKILYYRPDIEAIAVWIN